MKQENRLVTSSSRSWWRNCALHADEEIIAIDAMEDRIAPLTANLTQIRELITGLELCHHKAARWVYNIVVAIGIGKTSKGLGTRSQGRQHPIETVWQNACTALSAWNAGCPADKVDLLVDTIPASQLLTCLGGRSPLKQWQVQRVIEKTRSLINWPHSRDDPAAEYAWLLLSVGEYEFTYLDRCPECYKDHEEFWQTTVRTFIRDTENGDQANLSLALAIDNLWPCHWNFAENLQIVLEAIGGKLNTDTPFSACGRNISLVPIRGRMETISNTLMAFCGTLESGQDVDKELLELLGKQAEEKRWLAASLAKTIRLQLNPPADMRAISSMAGPDWINKE
ncbi:MAG: hypothetical protein KME56_02835 [Candidatus Thiodiazotropha sp. (ex Ctena orbiculata)]|uniref:Uncharacterized protein n=1 Tax=Candidatus Thiodiazotropha taylori TaxID=2792791 RepID=A0A944QTM4_9GAMM|nr:hypothetical protein [Candidatus Thiodiazotropha taylori]MBT2989237.1 hypothetical protein [Candidatus Thiodiazotropha taylori]MBT2995552.1 hypothetical protein [Candidatus Thiodiazotropha taylori]MBT2999494.1 hypothetical protein [Candidatus Thiodiazotropha taylori]MBV2106587.1 hypothetical protein [Candidatus Thiodiazotropha taylori]